jgi:hypothetical protein
VKLPTWVVFILLFLAAFWAVQNPDAAGHLVTGFLSGIHSIVH